jgi:glutaminyl-tRNA synthetase
MNKESAGFTKDTKNTTRVNTENPGKDTAPGGGKTTEQVQECSRRGNFIRHIIEDDLKSGKHDTIVTRFPPEPNGYIHIGHAKSICLNFGLAKDYDGRCHLRFDDTNPAREDTEYVDSIIEDVRWLGWDWGEHLYYASDYFDRLHDYAMELIRAGKAYVCFLSPDELIEYRGTLTRPGKDSPYRDTAVEENLELFKKMKNGEYEEGECCLRAKIDMSSQRSYERSGSLQNKEGQSPSYR